jgi:hypothetical protein
MTNQDQGEAIVEGEVASRREPPRRVQVDHPASRIIGDLNEQDMSREFETSMMGELQFFLELQIKQSKEGTFVHQAKYTKDIVRKFKMEDSKAMETPMSTTTALDADEEGEHVDQKEY